MANTASWKDVWAQRLQQVVTFLFLIYVLFLLGRSAWKNAQSNREMDDLKSEIAMLRETNARLGYLILYQKTETFRELEARRKLGIKRPGELVIALPAEPTIAQAAEQQEAKTAATKALLGEWWKYYFG